MTRPAGSPMRTRDWSRGLSTTEIGAGVAQFGNLNRVTSDEASYAAIDAAWDGGVRYFDTAPHYGLGLSERRLGAALSGRPRDEFIVSTKVGRLLVPNPAGEQQQDDGGFVVPASLRREWDFSRDGVLRSLDGSLDRLGLDRVDIVYVHDPDDHETEAIAEAIPTLVELRDEGVVGAIGVGMNQSAMPARFVERTDIDAVMIAGELTLLDQPALDELLPVARERGVAVVAAAVYNSGLLATERVRPEATYAYGPVPQELRDRTGRIAEIAAAFGTTVPAAAVQFALRHPAVVSVVVGVRTDVHLRDALERYGADIPEGFWDALVEAALLPADAFGAA